MRAWYRARLQGWRDSLRRPVVLTRGTVLKAGAGVGVACAIGIALATVGLVAVASETRDRLAADVLTRGDVESIFRRLAPLEEPTDKQLEQRIRRQLVLCAKTPACRRSFVRLARSTTLVVTPVPVVRFDPGPVPGSPPVTRIVVPVPRGVETPAPRVPPPVAHVTPPVPVTPPVVDLPPIDADGPDGPLPPVDPPPVHLLDLLLEPLHRP